MINKLIFPFIFFLSHIAINAMGSTGASDNDIESLANSPLNLQNEITIDKPKLETINHKDFKHTTIPFFSDESIPKHKLITLGQYIYDNQPYYINIPKKYKNIFSANIIGESNITTKDFVLVKGYNKTTKTVFINNEKVRCDQNGNFSFSTTLPKNGYNNLYISFKTSDNKFICIVKQINKLTKTSDNNNKVTNLNNLLFMNSNMINKKHNQKLYDKVLRKDLAYFLYHLDNNHKEKEFNTILIDDVNKNTPQYNEINYVVKNNLMGTYPNNKFYPNKTVNNVAVIVALTKSSNYSIKTDLKLTYHDFNNHHWAAPYIQTALEKNLLKQTQKLFPNSSLTFKQFSDMALTLPAVKNNIQQMKVNQQNNITTFMEYEKNVSNMITHLINSTKDKKNIHFELATYKNNSVSYEKNITINGTILPPLLFTFDKKNITPSLNGSFYINLELQEGINTFNITHNNISKEYTIYHLNKFNDLNNHWIHETAAKLKYLGLVENTPNFNPTKNISREDFVNITYPFYMQTISSKNKITSKNVQDFNEFSITKNINIKHYVNHLINQNILTLNNNYFYPKKNMTRIEALAAIVKYKTNFQDENSKLKTKKTKELPFWDIPKNYWGVPYISYALEHKWISHSYTFNPNDYITKDQFYSILTKSNLIDLNF